MENENVYQQKYLKYKQKYINLVEQLGGIAYKPGKYVFLFNSRILGAGTPLLNSIDKYGKLDKPDFSKITDEIGNHNGWYYYPSLLGKPPQLKIIESSAKIASTATMAAASATKAGLSTAASGASAAAKKAGDKVHETYCNSCRKSCEIKGGSAISTIDLDEATKGITKGITKDYVQGLVNLLAEKGIEVNRAIHCEIGFTSNKIIDYYNFTV